MAGGKVGFGGRTVCASQLDEFKELLPEYGWIMAQPAGRVARVKGSFDSQWEFEGLGLISRKEIVSLQVVNLKQTSFQDRNKRIALHAKVQIGPHETDTVDVVSVHFSYDPQQQCDNAADVIQCLATASLARPVVLGDFNVYGETSAAISLLTGNPKGQLRGRQPTCPGRERRALQDMKALRDAWLLDHQTHHNGLSFSNMPTPGSQSRPDRILVGRGVSVATAVLIRQESDYWKRHHRAATFQRAKVVIMSAYYSFLGVKGYPCLHDCGPHGSCRCGVCVTGGNQNNCHLPSCPECSGDKFVVFVVVFVFVILCLFFTFISVIRVLVVSARFSQNDILDILGYRCCLFNQQLYFLPSIPRKFRTRCSRVFLLSKLPPMLAILVTLIMLLFAFLAMHAILYSSIGVIVSILPEEKFPSDHKMLFAKLELQ